MKLLVAYGTREGHSRTIARRTADGLYADGHTVEVLNLRDADDLDPTRFDGAILIAPVHLGHYPKTLTTFVAQHATALAELPTLLVSVSLTAAGHEADDWLGLEKILDDLTQATGWTPGQVVQVAGAYKPSDYDIVTGFVMRRIIARRDPGQDPHVDHVYTDWAALDRTVDDWVARAGQGRADAARAIG